MTVAEIKKYAAIIRKYVKKVDGERTLIINNSNELEVKIAMTKLAKADQNLLKRELTEDSFSSYN